MAYHFSPTRLVIILESDSIKYWQRYESTGLHYTCLMGMKICIMTLGKNFGSSNHFNGVHALRFGDVNPRNIN